MLKPLFGHVCHAGVEFLFKCTCFDNLIDREKRKKSDKLAAIMDVWDKFVPPAANAYFPGSVLTVDEPLAWLPSPNFMQKTNAITAQEIWFKEVLDL
jgi:hypothetical protein